MKLRQRLAIKYIRTKFRLLSKVSKKKAAEAAFELFTTPQSRLLKAMPPIFKKAESLVLQFDGIKTQGYRWNHSTGAKKVLILHGHESSIVNFDHYVQPMIQKGYEVLAFDAPAHGLSGGKKINVVDYKNFILEIFREYGPITSFISHSFGGLAISLALEELNHDESWKVVLIAPATETIRAVNNFCNFLKLDDDVKEEIEQLIVKTGNKPSSWYSVSRAAENIKAQVLFLQDKRDALTPLSDVEPIMAKNYPNFRFVVSDGLGHRNIYKDKTSLRLITEFL